MIGSFPLLDILLVLLLAGYAASGYRQGMVVSVLSLAGFLGGGALAMAVMPSLLDSFDAFNGSPLLRALVLVFAVFAIASVGQAIAVALGGHVRARVPAGPGRVIDSILGMVVVLVSVSVLIWFVAGALRGGAPAPVAKAVGESRVLRAIDAVVPPQTSKLFAGFRRALDREGFPRVFEGLQAEPIRPVDPPDPNVIRSAGVEAAAGSVVKITGVAASCNRGQEGSGWVVAPGRVVTNAHVVAGLTDVTVRPRGTGESYTGRVVIFDPERDLAVLAVTDLPSRPLRLGTDLKRGDAGVVAGFPLDGPYRLDAARIRQVIDARGADIYGNPGTVREVYSMYARVRPGNSGGPLLDPSGRVVGVIFAKSLDDNVTGYALTLDEARPIINAAGSASRRVSTGACVSG
ncbi:MAG TPA: MarP family serine protease [Dermatophilaceae bacterium]|nr:MarP family serine protease [Dermatophilaceae bacterium]